MTDKQITDDSPASALFPEFDSLYDLIAVEVEGLTDEQLDWSSESYGWSEWSIRVQLSHMASLIYRWLILRWGEVTFPDGEHGIEDVEGLGASPYDRRMDDAKYYELPTILTKLREGIELARRVLSGRSVGFVRAHSVTQTLNEGWALMIQSHPSGVSATEQANHMTMNLEGSMRHIYFEEITHLFNIQRIKRAQGLKTVSDLPRVGYWTIEGWDVSEAAAPSSGSSGS